MIHSELGKTMPESRKFITLNSSYTKTHLVQIILLFMGLTASAQDLHYSQFYNSPQNLNPALTGIFNGSQRYNLSVRDQWRFVPVPWFTFSGAFDKNILPVGKTHFYGWGINFNYDKQGDSRLVLAGLNLSGSISKELNPRNIITGGATLGFARRGFNTSDLTWDKQWDGRAFNGGLDPGESFDLDAVTFLETALGANYRWQKNARTKIDFGIGAFHLLQPKTTFYNTPEKKLPTHMTFTLKGNFKLAKALDLQLHGLHQLQSAYNESLMGFLAKIYVNQKRGKETQLHVGGGYRTAGSIIPTVALQWNQWYASFSYDIDNTKINNAINSKRGGPEIHVTYIFNKVRPLEERKTCPIY